jgi:hypothetical protein
MAERPSQLDIRWESVETSPGVAYRFPDPITQFLRERWTRPAVYRWSVHEPASGQVRLYYVGESARFVRRLRSYLHPGPRQRTALRLHARFNEELQRGRRVELEVLQFDQIEVAGEVFEPHDLRGTSVRRLLENLLIVRHQRAGDILLNAGDGEEDPLDG